MSSCNVYAVWDDEQWQRFKRVKYFSGGRKLCEFASESSLPCLVHHSDNFLFYLNPIEPCWRMTCISLLISPANSWFSKFKEMSFQFGYHYPATQLWQQIFSYITSLERLVPCGCSGMKSCKWELKSAWSILKGVLDTVVPLS